MLRSLALLLPVLFPSWRFFAMIAPSPRIEVALLSAGDEAPQHWRAFRPRPERVPPPVMVRRLVWNPRWNETLLLVVWSERFLDSGSPRVLSDIIARIRADLVGPSGAAQNASHFRVRFIMVSRADGRLVREEVYRSEAHALAAEPAA